MSIITKRIFLALLLLDALLGQVPIICLTNHLAAYKLQKFQEKLTQPQPFTGRAQVKAGRLLAICKIQLADRSLLSC
jgi:hypothetical protein